jgi:hypothetical protein
MTTNETDETLLEAQDNAEADLESQDSEQETESKTVELPDNVKAELEALRKEKEELTADKERLANRLGIEKGTKVTFAKLVRKQLEDGLIDEQEAQELTGYDAKRLRGMLDAPEMADNPIEAQRQHFQRLYVDAGVKSTLDEIYGTDTGQYAQAFGNYAASNAALMREFESIDPAKVPGFVVKKGKELFEKFGSDGPQGYIAKLEAKLAAYENSDSKGQTTSKREVDAILPSTQAPVLPNRSERAKALFG